MIERDDRFERRADKPERARLRRPQTSGTDPSNAGGAKAGEICDLGPVGAGRVPELGRVDDRPELLAGATERHH